MDFDGTIYVDVQIINDNSDLTKKLELCFPIWAQLWAMYVSDKGANEWANWPYILHIFANKSTTNSGFVRTFRLKVRLTFLDTHTKTQKLTFAKCTLYKKLFLNIGLVKIRLGKPFFLFCCVALIHICCCHFSVDLPCIFNKSIRMVWKKG